MLYAKEKKKKVRKITKRNKKIGISPTLRQLKEKKSNHPQTNSQVVMVNPPS
jgi:hypothetical protein